MTDGGLRMLAAYPDSILFLGGYSPFVYYAVADYREEDGYVSYGYSLYRANVESGAVMELPLTRAYSTENAMSTGDFPSVYAFENDRILWYAPGEDGIEFYTTDLAGHDRQQLPIDDPHVMNGAYSDGWAYYTIRNHDLPAPSDGELGRLKFQNENSLYRYSFDTGETELLADNVAQYIVTEDGIFYTVMESNYYAENLRHSLHTERTEDGFMCSFGGMERFVSFEEIGQALQKVRWWTVFRSMKHLPPRSTVELALFTASSVCRTSMRNSTRLFSSLPIF